FLPSLLLISLLIKVGSPGPVFCRARRIGGNGQPFNLLKFRTADIGGQRLTTIGRILRKSSLDEFPILWNVLHGDLALLDVLSVAQKPVHQQASAASTLKSLLFWAVLVVVFALIYNVSTKFR